MTHIPKRFSLVLLISVAFLFSCKTSSIVDSAVKKQGAAMYTFKQNDFQNAKKYCQEANELWLSVKNADYSSTPDWAIGNYISRCEELLSRLPDSSAIDSTVFTPIRITKNRIFVDVMINQTSQATLLLDTGATCSLLTPEFADKLGIHPEAEEEKHTVKLLGKEQVKMPFVSLEEIKIGEAAVTNLNVGIYPAFPEQPHIHGILGADYLMHYKITIDHDTGTLKLEM